MTKGIPIALNPTHTIEIDGGLIARALGLDQDTFFRLLAQRKISQLCERGTGEDEGMFRASFYHHHIRARIVVDRAGNSIGGVERSERTAGNR